MLLSVCSAVLGVRSVSAIAAKTNVAREVGSIPNQLQTLSAAFTEESYANAFKASFSEAMSDKAKSEIPPKDTSNSEGSMMYEKELRSKMLRETTKLLHAVEVAKQIEVLNYSNAPEERFFNAADAEDTARKMVTQLAESLVRSGSPFGGWVPGMATVYSKFVASVINGVELLIPSSSEDLSGEIGRLAASVGLLLSTIVERGVYTADQIKEAFVASKMHIFFSDLGVTISLS